MQGGVVPRVLRVEILCSNIGYTVLPELFQCFCLRVISATKNQNKLYIYTYIFQVILYFWILQ